MAAASYLGLLPPDIRGMMLDYLTHRRSEFDDMRHLHNCESFHEEDKSGFALHENTMTLRSGNSGRKRAREVYQERFGAMSHRCCAADSVKDCLQSRWSAMRTAEENLQEAKRSCVLWRVVSWLRDGCKE